MSNLNVISIEETVVANLLQHNELLGKLALKPEMFSDERCQKFITYVLETGNVDVNHLYHKSLQDDHFYTKDDLSRLYNEEFISENHFIQHQMDVLAEYQKRKATEEVSNFLNDRNIKNFYELSDKLAELKQFSIIRQNETEDYIQTVIENLFDDQPKELITTGFDGMDRFIQGFEKGQLNIIAARPSVGKTGFALNMMWNIARLGYSTSFFSLETSGEGIIRRIVSNISNVQLNLFKTPQNITNDDTTKVLSGLDMISKQLDNFRIITKAGATPQDVRSDAINNRDRKHVIFIDYLQLMESDVTYGDRQVEVSKISRDLKKIALETGCIIIALSQLSRGVEQRQNKRPMMSDLRESGAIEQDANMIMFLYRDDYYDRDEIDEENGISEVECIIAKNRDGQTGTVLFNYFRPTQKFHCV